MPRLPRGEHAGLRGLKPFTIDKLLVSTVSKNHIAPIEGIETSSISVVVEASAASKNHIAPIGRLAVGFLLSAFSL